LVFRQRSITRRLGLDRKSVDELRAPDIHSTPLHPLTLQKPLRTPSRNGCVSPVAGTGSHLGHGEVIGPAGGRQFAQPLELLESHEQQQQRQQCQQSFGLLVLVFLFVGSPIQCGYPGGCTASAAATTAAERIGLRIAVKIRIDENL